MGSFCLACGKDGVDCTLFVDRIIVSSSGKTRSRLLCADCHRSIGWERIANVLNPEPIENRFEILDL
ncbi:MAG: hypothetical protein ACTSSP_01025 [Candidatus Asgardarchaeia archaeon]